jgi:hypothetical protein
LFKNFLTKNIVAILERLPHSSDLASVDMCLLPLLKSAFEETSFWFLLHYNAPAHRSVLFKNFLTKNIVAILERPPHSFDLASVDMCLFPLLKSTFQERSVWFLLHYNAPAHRSVLFKDFLTKNIVAILERPPHSSDMASVDMCLFPLLISAFQGRRVFDATGIITNATKYLKRL